MKNWQFVLLMIPLSALTVLVAAVAEQILWDYEAQRACLRAHQQSQEPGSTAYYVVQGALRRQCR